MDSDIVGWMLCVTLKIMWKLLHCRWTVLLWFEFSVLQWTEFGGYCNVVGQCYCGLNGVFYSEHYVESTAHQVDSAIVGWMEYVTLNSMWKLLHSRRTMLLWLEWGVLQWTTCRCYCTSGGEVYCGLNEVCYYKHYVEVTAQQLDSGILCRKECDIVKIMWKLLHSWWAVVLWFECRVLHWTVFGSYFTTVGQ